MSESSPGAPAPVPAPQATPASAAPAPAAPNPRAARLSALLQAWTADCIHGSPVARDVSALNHMTQSALPELEKRILKEFG